MFQSIESNPEPKSSIQIKRDFLHKSRVTEERSKIKKSIRFSNLSQLLLKKNQPEYKFILQLSVSESQTKLNQLLQKKDFVALACCMIELQNKKGNKEEFDEIVTLNFMKDFVEESEDILYRPEIIGIYKALTWSSNEFYKIIFEHPKVIKNMTKQIQSLKSSPSQDLYLEVMEDLSTHYPKRYTEDINQLFDTIFEMLQNETISFEPGIKILKPLSLYINEKLQLNLSTVNRLLAFYEKEGENNQQKEVMQDIFLILTKIIYYQKNGNIETNWRLIKVVTRANIILPSKVIHGYYNIFLLLAKLVDKIARWEIESLSENQAKELRYKLIQKYHVEYVQETENSFYEITSTLINQLLNDCSLLQVNEYSPEYLYFIITISKFCFPELLLKHFHSADTFGFLVDSIDHSSLDISGLALEVFIVLLNHSHLNSQLLQILNDQFNLKAILENKLYKLQNRSIEKKLNSLLQIFDQFTSQI